jgi:DNA-binding LacI/PurR family transcriptional regulator
MSSVRAIAQQLKLSAATVSRVINNHPDVDETTRERVLAAINQSGYFPSTGRLQTNVLALAYPDDPVKTEYGSFEPALLSGIMRGLDEHQFDLKLLSIRRDKTPDETYTQFFMRKGVRGVIMRVFRHNRALISRIASERFPCVVVAEQFDDPEVNFIRSDSYPSSRRAMEHLIALGHRRIALAIHHVSDGDHMDRRRAYDDAIVNAGIKIDPRMIFEVSAGFNAGEQVLDRLGRHASRPRTRCIDPARSFAAWYGRQRHPSAHMASHDGRLPRRDHAWLRSGQLAHSPPAIKRSRECNSKHASALANNF